MSELATRLPLIALLILAIISLLLWGCWVCIRLAVRISNVQSSTLDTFRVLTGVAFVGMVFGGASLALLMLKLSIMNPWVTWPALILSVGIPVGACLRFRAQDGVRQLLTVFPDVVMALFVFTLGLYGYAL